MTHVTAQLDITLPRLSSPKDSADSDLTLPRACPNPAQRPLWGHSPLFSGHQWHLPLKTIGWTQVSPLTLLCSSPSALPHVPPGPHYLSSPGSYPAQPGPNRPARQPPAPSLASWVHAGALRPGEIGAIQSWRFPWACARSLALLQSLCSSASLCWPSEALPRSPRTRWWISCGPWSAPLCMLLPNASNSLNYAHIH